MTLIELLDDLGVSYKESGHRHSTAGWVQICCPSCGDENFKCGISLAHGNTNCWSCGPHRLTDTLAEITGLPWQQIKQLVAGIGYNHALNAPKLRRALVLPQGLQPLAQPHTSYLMQRGLSPETLTKLWNVQSICIHPKLAWRIFIPISYRGKVVSWTTRSLSDKGRRYITASAEEEAVAAKEILYGFDYVRHAAILCEGPTDVWKVGPGAVCCFGTSFTESQIALLAKIPVRIICFDNEPTAQQMAREVLWTLSAVPGETKNVVLDSKDPGSATDEEIKELRGFLE